MSNPCSSLFQHGEVFLLARDGVRTQEFFLFTQELISSTQEILFFYPRNYEHLTQEI